MEKQTSIMRRDIRAWCCYDWANSSYSTLIITVFVIYLQRVVFDEATWGNTGAIVWAWGLSASMLAGAALSPILGALADAQASKRRWLAITSLGGGLACVIMALVPHDYAWTVTACFILANLCFELSLTVYNGFLPEIAAEEEMNRVSSAGMGWGYFGGGVALLFAMLVLKFGGELGLAEMSIRLRWCIAGTGLWWSMFTLPTLFILRDKRRDARQRVGLLTATKRASHDAMATLFQVRRYAMLATFLVAFLFFNDGVQTVISQSSTFALREVHFTESELLGVILMVQFLAVPGAILIGRLADAKGQKWALVFCLIVWIGLLISAWFVETKVAYWCMAVGVALVLGGTQAVSRAVMGVLTPEEHAAKFFGFFNLSGKATSFMGTFVFGMVIAWTGSSRLAVVNLLIFFVIGLAILTRVNMSRGIQQRNAFPPSTTPSATKIGDEHGKISQAHSK